MVKPTNGLSNTYKILGIIAACLVIVGAVYGAAYAMTTAKEPGQKALIKIEGVKDQLNVIRTEQKEIKQEQKEQRKLLQEILLRVNR